MAETTLLERIDDALSSPAAIRLLGEAPQALADLEAMILDVLWRASGGAMRPPSPQSNEAALVRGRIMVWRDSGWPQIPVSA